jgi:hypothetical protein
MRSSSRRSGQGSRAKRSCRRCAPTAAQGSVFARRSIAARSGSGVECGSARRAITSIGSPAASRSTRMQPMACGTSISRGLGRVAWMRRSAGWRSAASAKPLANSVGQGGRGAGRAARAAWARGR